MRAGQDRYSTAVHEAGHVVVAWALGLKTIKMTVGISDDTAGRAEIEKNPNLPMIDRIAICSAGLCAQCMLGAPIHGGDGPFYDEAEISNLIEDYSEEEGEVLRRAGDRRSKELLALHRAKVEHLAEALAERMELDQAAIDRILASDGQ
jgi:ATP-dependent Zn protease